VVEAEITTNPMVHLSNRLKREVQIYEMNYDEMLSDAG
jgi:hypothetical protein